MIDDFIKEITNLRCENERLETQLKKQKEINKKAIEYINIRQRKDGFLELNEWQTRDLLQILEDKEV